jgi:hypothetical protein
MRPSKWLGRNLVPVVALAAGIAIPACSDDDGQSSTGSAGKAGSGGSSAGAAGTGGSSAGTAGSSAGTAGSSAGPAGSGGASGGSGGSSSDAGAGGEPSMGGAPSCELPFPPGEGGAGGDGGGGEGGGNTGPTGPAVVAIFDTAGTLATPIGNWQVGGSPVPDSFIRRNASEGASCPGSLELNVPFTTYGTQTDVQINFNPAQDWTGRSTLHAKVKIPDPGTGNLNHLNGVNLAVLSDNYANYDNKFVSASTFADFAWHDVALDLSAGDPPPTLPSIIQIQVQLQAAGEAPSGGPSAPISTTLLVDDIWIE